MGKQYTDAEILSAIKAGGAEAEEALKQLYARNRAMLKKFIRRNNGTEEQSKDLLQDTIIAFYEQVRNGQYTHRSKLSTYLYSVARFTWMNRLKRKKLEQSIPERIEIIEVEESALPKLLEKEKEARIVSLFDKLGDTCRTVLELSFYHNYSMKEICVATHYQNEQAVRNKKAKCMRALRTLIEQNPEIKKILKDV